MPNVSRWLHWTPENTRTPELTGDKTAKTDGNGLFADVLSVLAPVSSGLRPPTAPPVVVLTVPPAFRDPAPYMQDFARWALAHCAFRDGCWGGVAALAAHFSAWCAVRGDAGPWTETFATLLTDEGFGLDPERGLVYGLLLREDADAARALPSAHAHQTLTSTARKPVRRGDLLCMA